MITSDVERVWRAAQDLADALPEDVVTHVEREQVNGFAGHYFSGFLPTTSLTSRIQILRNFTGFP